MAALEILKDTVIKGLTKLASITPKISSTTATVPGALESATLQSTPKFSLETFGKRSPVKVIDVYDGDTIVVAMKVFNTISAFRIRLAHIDTPEIRPAATVPDRANIIKRAEAAKAYLASLVMDKIVWIDILGYEKYGRLLADLYSQETGTTSISECMVRKGHGIAYEGGTKQ